MAKVAVREVRPGDGEAIAAMHREDGSYYFDLAPEDFRLPDEDGLADFVEPASDANSETTLALVAEVDGEVAGYLEARLLPPAESARYQIDPAVAHTRLFISFLSTSQKYWRRGVGTRLVEAAEEWGRAGGATIAVTETYGESPVSIPFWERRMGYERRAVILRKPLA